MVVRWVLWAAVVCVWAGVGEGTSALDMGVCRSGCFQVPEDLWPYCCESHNTCCTEFAKSCMHDCLPRVHTGDVSVVEERPGLCCALYNLCCFRETYRLSSFRKTGEEPISFPIVHRFHTGAIPTQKPISLPGLATRPQGRQPVQSRQTLTEHPQQESTPKRTNPFRSQPLKKPSRPEFPQALTKIPIKVEERNPPPAGKILVRDNLQDRRKAITDVEVKKVKSRPKPPTSLLSPVRKEVGDERKAEEPKLPLGPRRPSFQSISRPKPEDDTLDIAEGRAGRRPGNRRPKIKRLRRPVEGEEESQGNTRDRSPQGRRQRPSQQGVRERPEQAIRKRPTQQAGRERTEQSERKEQTRRAQATDARRVGRIQSSDGRRAVSQKELDHTQAVDRRENVQARPVRPQQVQDLSSIVADDQLGRIQGQDEIAPDWIQNANEEHIDVTQVSAGMLEKETKMEEVQQIKTGEINTELVLAKIPGEMVGIDAGDQTHIKMDEESLISRDIVADQSKKEMDIIPDQSVAGTETKVSQPQIPAKEMMKITNNQELTVQPSRTETAAGTTTKSSGRSVTRVRPGNSEARTRSSTSQTRNVASEGRGRTRVAEPSPGPDRAQTRTRSRSGTRPTEPSQGSGRAQGRTREGRRGRIQAQQIRSETGDRTQAGRRTSRRQ